jgi:hypothetical protein
MLRPSTDETEPRLLPEVQQFLKRTTKQRRFQSRPRWYSRLAFSKTMFRVTSVGTSAKFSSITFSELGNVESAWGKSDAHI